MRPCTCLAVMYHYVRERAGTPHSAIRGLDPTAFEAQLDELCAEREPIDWPALRAWLGGDGSIPERSFLLTFDDGLADHADVVCPILEARGLRGTFFVSGEVLATGRMLPAHQIHLLQCVLGDDGFAAEVTRYLVDSVAVGLPVTDELAARRIYHYESPARAVFKYVLTQALPIETRNRMLDALFAAHVGDSRDCARAWYLSWRQLDAMQAAGHTIGGHGFRHEPYLRLSPEEQRADLTRAALLLQEGLGADPRPFSYPYGSFDDATKRACGLARFAHAFTTQPLLIGLDSDAYALGRVDTIALSSFLVRESGLPWTRFGSVQGLAPNEAGIRSRESDV